MTGCARCGYRLDPVLPASGFTTHLNCDPAEVSALWPPETAGRVLGGAPREGKEEGEEARDVLRRFMARAYRRPVAEEEVERMAGLFAANRGERGSFEEPMKEPLTPVLT